MEVPVRHLVAAIAVLLLASATLRADDAKVDPRERAEEQAMLVGRAFGNGVAPAPEIGREARRALESYVDALPAAKRASTRLHTDDVDVLLAKAAWAAGDRAAAGRRAESVLDALRTRRSDWDSGNIFHEMHILLGRVALESDDLPRAELHLLRAAKTPGSPQLDSFGPDWTLARDLLARGRREAVSAYMLRVGAFWESGRDRLAEWKRTLARGGTPQFLPEPTRDPSGEEAPKPRREIGEPPVFGTPDGLVGVWESTARSLGGIGHALEFREDGQVVTYMLVMVEMKYRVEGDRLFRDDGAEELQEPLGTIEGDVWKTTLPVAEERTVPAEKKRVGRATPGADPLVGVWMYGGAEVKMQVFERYDANGWCRFRVLLPSDPTPRPYERRGDTLRLGSGAAATEHALVLSGDRLRLEDEGKHEYRYAGKHPWWTTQSPQR